MEDNNLKTDLQKDLEKSKPKGANNSYNSPLMAKVREYNKLARVYINHAPKFERYGGLATDILRQGNKVLALIVRCNKKFHKKTDLTELDINHEILREFWRTFFELGYFNFRRGKEEDTKPEEALRRFASINRLIDEIGAMIGAWIQKNLNKC